MKKRNTTEQSTTNGFYISEVEQGFLGAEGEGKQVLSLMGLPVNELPFSVATFLHNRKICWRDSQGRTAHISFLTKENQLICTATYLGNTKSARIFREWSDYENPEKIARLESMAIGELCMNCIRDKLKTT